MNGEIEETFQPEAEGAAGLKGAQLVPAIGVRFGIGESVVYYRRGRLHVVPGDLVVAQIDRAVDVGRVVSVCDVDEERIERAGSVLRRANERDIARQKSLAGRRKEALRYCRERIEAHRLPMKLIDCHCTLDGRRLVFYFAAEGRVDFRALVRDLAHHFHCRIELRQVGVRDHARMLGGLGPCGRPLCCAQFLKTFEPVSIRAAKDQGIALNPAKLSGLCDRLMCCLLYEHACYRELSKDMPKVGEVVDTPQGPGKVEAVNVLAHTVAVELEDGRKLSFSAGELRRELGSEAGQAAEADQEELEPTEDVEVLTGEAEAEASGGLAEIVGAVEGAATPASETPVPSSAGSAPRSRRWRRRRRPGRQR
ncbi:MAG: stage 0 sporulation family protein [Armatimonadetes bacterium]|nr:stage 0 sporulation family protein [Armatimonadota bacterium]